MSASDQIAAAAAIVALCAFFATAWQAYQAQLQTKLVARHNRLSVRPLLVWNTSRTRFDAGCEFTFTVCNYGVGPAIVRDRYFTIDGKRFTPDEKEVDELEALAKHVLGQTVLYSLKQHGLPGVGSAMKEGSELTVARLHFPRNGIDAIDAVLATRGDIQFCLDYECLYGERFELRS